LSSSSAALLSSSYQHNVLQKRDGGRTWQPGGGHTTTLAVLPSPSWNDNDDNIVVRHPSLRLEVSTTHFHDNIVETHPQCRRHPNGVANWPQPVMTASSPEALVVVVAVVVAAVVVVAVWWWCGGGRTVCDRKGSVLFTVVSTTHLGVRYPCKPAHRG
jgi:hypothetical protein